MTTYVFNWQNPGDPVEMAKETKEAEAAMLAAVEEFGWRSVEVDRADEIAMGKVEEFMRVFKNHPNVYLRD